MPDKKPGIDELCINTLRFLAIDAVEKAKSGHPGAPMGAAAMAYVLWHDFLKHNPADPAWPDRDRFVLSAGHASALLYALLHLTGYDLSLEEIKRFRQWGSRTPGHPEHGLTPGVEATTGPLGQGFANAVGMAVAERWLAATYNRPGHEVINHFTYALVSDGDLEEGVTSEAASLAGTLGLGKLIFLYDDNGISIEGSTAITFKENVAQRFEAYGWHVVGPIDGFDTVAVRDALTAAKTESAQPSLIICRTEIGHGSPNKAGKASSHGEPLGADEVRLTRERLGWAYEPFTVPPQAAEHMRQAIERGRKEQDMWEAAFMDYSKAYPDDARQLQLAMAGGLPEGWDKGLGKLFDAQSKPLSTREASGMVLNALAGSVPYLLGGSADLAPSTKTYLKGCGDFERANYAGRNFHFGVREHAMGAVSNGMALHGGVIPYTGTFLIFYDYMRPAVRLAALMGQPVIFVFTHDSVGLGEDGPTHQPVEQLVGLRSVPGLVTLRPADAAETAQAWRLALERRDGPTALALSRQNLPLLNRKFMSAEDGVSKGGYVLWEASGPLQVVLIATGSEVHIALEAGRLLEQKGINSRVVSLPSWEIFDGQHAEYRESVLPSQIKARISIEAGLTLGWERYTGQHGSAIGVNRFGASAPAEVLYQKLGLTAEHIVHEAVRLLQAAK